MIVLHPYRLWEKIIERQSTDFTIKHHHPDPDPDPAPHAQDHLLEVVEKTQKKEQ